MPTLIERNTTFIKNTAQQLGFDYCGISKAEELTDDARKLEQWLNKGMHGEMYYMTNHFEKRIDPRKLVDGAKSVITLSLNYYPTQLQNDTTYKVSKYAYGNDYHDVIREKLKELLQLCQTNIGQINGRGFVDSAPVLERAWAQKSGLGWIGKNGNLIHKQAGSFFFLATLIVDIDLLYDDPMIKDYCGNCTRCVDTCPTEAILPNKTIDGSKCISYFTIELKNELIQSEKSWDNWIFGCDVCQDVCPWNRFSKPNTEISFSPSNYIIEFTSKEWESLNEESFKILFKNSPIKRSKLTGIKRNIRFIKKAND